MKAKTLIPEKQRSGLLAGIRKYHFELKHIIVIFIILVSAQILISLTQKSALQHFLLKTQESYQQDSSERLANLTATALELLLTTASSRQNLDAEEKQRVVEAFNIIMSQQVLLSGVDDICLLVSNGNNFKAIDNGQDLYDYFFANWHPPLSNQQKHSQALSIYKAQKDRLKQNELIQSQLAGEGTFHVFVPFVPKGEYAGALYMRNTPDFTFITHEILSSYNESSLIFIGLILFGFLAMFLISSYTLQERNQVQEQLYLEREQQLKERIEHQKEAMFTKRIYHTYHKAEKVMGFIKDDLRCLTQDNIEETRARVTKYANFISRVIYDMKWYDPPLQAIRNSLFHTDLNDVVRFLVNNICLRVCQNSEQYQFQLDLDSNLPPVTVNEFVIWEILEPLFQNSMDHNAASKVTIRVKTEFNLETGQSRLIISDNGTGFAEDLLQTDENGRKRLFLEHVSTKPNRGHSGYGCYLAYEISKQRCGWHLDAENLPEGGCRYILTIPQI